MAVNLMSRPYSPSLTHSPRHVQRQGDRRARRIRSRHRDSQRGDAMESIAMLSVNVLLMMVALIALVKLIPYNLAQRTKIQTLELEVSALQERVNNLRGHFSRYADPQQTESVMREQSDRMREGQARIIWLERTEMKPHDLKAR